MILYRKWNTYWLSTYTVKDRFDGWFLFGVIPLYIRKLS
jgi:hypothetical protein